MPAPCGRGVTYSCYSFLTSELATVSDQRYAPATHYPREWTTGPIGQEAGWASEVVWTQRLEEISFAFAGDQTPVVQSVIRPLLF